jgi:hypothetical protein
VCCMFSGQPGQMTNPVLVISCNISCIISCITEVKIDVPCGQPAGLDCCVCFLGGFEWDQPLKEQACLKQQVGPATCSCLTERDSLLVTVVYTGCEVKGCGTCSWTRPCGLLQVCSF